MEMEQDIKHQLRKIRKTTCRCERCSIGLLGDINNTTCECETCSIRTHGNRSSGRNKSEQKVVVKKHKRKRRRIKKLKFLPEEQNYMLTNTRKETLEKYNNSKSNEDDKVGKYQPARRKIAMFFPERVSDFRTVSLFPRPEDVFGQRPFLYPNITEGPYRSVDHYLDIHFKLLREDFMGPIRKGLKHYKAQCNTKGKLKPINNIRIYRKVKFLHAKTICDKICYEVCFDVDNKHNQINGENRMMFGSLLLFTSDHFDTFFIGTVATRSIIQLKNKCVTVELQGLPPNAKSVLGKEFVMVESEAFFLPYFHVLKSLQLFNSNNFPLAKYIVDVNTRTSMPKYIERYNNENVFEHVQYTVEGVDKYFTFNIAYDEDWPTCEDLGLDISQYEAYKAALTNDMVIIQGPPGTGKTFLGLQIVKALLHNSQYWLGSEHDQCNTPILVVCFKNHALDQFLRGLVNVTEKLVRLGGGSNVSELDKFNIKEIRKNSYNSNAMQMQMKRQLQKQMTAVFAEINILQTDLQTLYSTDGILSLRTLGLVSEYVESFFWRDDILVDWLLERGIVRETQSTKITNVEEEKYMRHVFFDWIDLDSDSTWIQITPPEDDVKVYFACTITNIKIQQQQIEKELHSNKANEHDQTKHNSTLRSLNKVLKYLETKLIGSNLFCSDNERERLLSARDLYALESNDRWKLYSILVNTLQTELMEKLERKQAEFKEYALKHEHLCQANDLKILKQSHVVGVTTTLAAQYQSLLNDLAPKIVFVEEAAEVLESHIIASLSKGCQHLIMIGDHKQLRPLVTDNRLARKYHLDLSLFERMVKNNMVCHTLTLQHRMRPAISKLLVPTFYPTLRDHLSVMRRDHIKGMEKNVFFMMHNHFENNVKDTGSKQNSFEASMVLNMAKYLVLQGYSPEEITVLTPYKGQMHYMTNEMLRMSDFPKGIHITSVDCFQGEENRIILLSLVRSSDVKKIGFLSIENRVCVALSRARDGLYVFGNMDTLVSSSKLWGHIRESFKQQQAIGPNLRLLCQNHTNMVTTISSGDDFKKVSHGGCSLICSKVLPCGHKCKALCHLEKDCHERCKCKELCLRVLCQYGHQCRLECNMKCGKCLITRQRRLPCDHIANLPCSMDIRNYDCPEMVEVVVPNCGHLVTSTCDERESPLCTHLCKNRLDCGHCCEKLCHEDDDPLHTEFRCTKPCARLNKDCLEDHACGLLCYERCKPCSIRMTRTLACGHTCSMLCRTDPDRIECTKMCNRTRDCGHDCIWLCCEPCGPCPIIVDKMVPRCGHLLTVACSTPPNELFCGGQCPSILACGHTCKLRCYERCADSKCECQEFRMRLLTGIKNFYTFLFTRLAIGYSYLYAV